MQLQDEVIAAPSQDEAEEKRILIVFDGEAWFIRNVLIIENQMNLDGVFVDLKLYHCDRHLGGPFTTLDEAVKAAKEILHGHQRAA
jgi:hypothetical protein